MSLDHYNAVWVSVVGEDGLEEALGGAALEICLGEDCDHVNGDWVLDIPCTAECCKENRPYLRGGESKLDASIYWTFKVLFAGLDQRRVPCSVNSMERISFLMARIDGDPQFRSDLIRAIAKVVRAHRDGEKDPCVMLAPP